MPIEWDELDETDPDRWTLHNAPSRIDAAGPWPEARRFDVAVVEALADEHGVQADEPFDRFGRNG